MEVKGKLHGITKDLVTGKLLMTFSVDNVTEEVNGWGEKDLRLKAVIWRNIRSKNANAYLWVLLGELAKRLHTSSEELYENYIQMNPVFVVNDDGYEVAYIPHGKQKGRGEHEHWLFLKTVEVMQEKTPGVYIKAKLDTYARLKGSSMFDTKEMAHFLDLVIEDCKEQGIETLTPAEIERMKAEWK